jgi:hypothetical protein
MAFKRSAIIAGKILLGDAQKKIKTDWYATYLEMKKGQH